MEPNRSPVGQDPITLISSDVRWLISSLYGLDGEGGDINEIKNHLQKSNSTQGKHGVRLTRLEVLLGPAALALIAGLLKVFGVY